jgi:nucleoside-diphosphate-sugar epimerase
MKILVTGANGFLGSAVTEHLLKKGNEVVGVDKNEKKLKLNNNVIVGDLRDLDFCDRIMAGVNVVIHLAATTYPTDSRHYSVFANNVDSTFALFSSAAHAKVEKVIYASSLAIYGVSFSEHEISPKYVPIDELHPIVHDDSYALSKNVNELSAQMWNALTGLSFIGIRFAWISEKMKLIELISQTSNKNPDQLYKLSKYLWSFLDLRDAVHALETVVTSNFQGVDVFNLAASKTFVNQPTRELIDEYFPNCEIKRKLEAFQSPITSEKFISRFGYRPKFLFDESTSDMVEAENFKE